MNIPRTNVRTRFLTSLAAPVALTLVLAGCAPASTPAPAPADAPAMQAATTSGDFPTFVAVVAAPMPTAPPAPGNPAMPARATTADIPHHGPGLYRLDLGAGSGPTGEQQHLTCMVHREKAEEKPGDLISCEADFPVRWKELDGQHRQARTVIISQEADGDLDVRAEVEPMRAIRIVPTDITGEAVLSGMYVSLADNEARFSTDPDKEVGGVLITPDSFEVITDRTTGNYVGQSIKASPTATVRPI